MKTTGAMGEVVGMAAALCARHDCSPREVHSRHLGELQNLMRRGAGKLPVQETAFEAGGVIVLRA